MLDYQKACDMVRRVRIKAGHFEKVYVTKMQRDFLPPGESTPMGIAVAHDYSIHMVIDPFIDHIFTDQEIEAGIAHEFGHLVNGHLLRAAESDEEFRQREFEADQFATSIGYGRALMELLRKVMPTENPNGKHPKVLERANRVQYALVELEDQKKAA